MHTEGIRLCRRPFSVRLSFALPVSLQAQAATLEEKHVTRLERIGLQIASRPAYSVHSHMAITQGGKYTCETGRSRADNALVTPDIRPVVEAAAGEHGDVTQIPAPTVLPAIQACRIRRRQRGRG